MSTPVIAIDGPSGSGKSTVARGVGAALGLRVLETGAMYRAVGLAALDTGVDLADEGAVARVAHSVSIAAEPGATLLDGRDVTAEIRTPAATDASSCVAALPAVRRELVAQQRAWLAEVGVGVVEGRDIGTVVFPDAALKVFLTADEETRARRRHEDERAAARESSAAEQRRRLDERDRRDSTRPASPLQAAADAVVIDTSARAVDDVVGEVIRLWSERGAPRDATRGST